MRIETTAVGLDFLLGRKPPLDYTPLLIFFSIDTTAVGLAFLLGRQFSFDWTPLLIFEHRDSRGWAGFSAREIVSFRLDPSLDFLA